MSDPIWLTEAIDAADAAGDHRNGDGSKIHFTRSAAALAVRAALPVIREGLAKEIEAVLEIVTRDGFMPGATGGRSIAVGLRQAVDMIREGNA